MSITKKEFLVTVTKSRVIELKELKAWLVEVDAVDGVDLANQMVRAKMLTEWQAKYLLTGRHRLDVSGYRLLERVSRDELGDRFLAIHRQLERQVDILFIAADLSKHEDKQQAFLARASDVMELDHPHLSHVYDLDREAGRYFLVTEHVDGYSWRHGMEQNDEISHYACRLNQVVDGIEHLHQNKIVFGGLTQDDLFIDQEYGAKILNIAISELRRGGAKNSENSSYASDWITMAKIGLESLELLDGRSLDKDRSTTTKLRQFLNDVVREPNQATIDQLKNCLRELQNKQSNESHQLSSVAEPLASDYGQQVNRATDRPTNPSRKATSKSTDNVKRKAGSQSPNDKYSRFLARPVLDHPTSFLTSSFLIGLIVVGLGTYLISGVGSSGSVVIAEESKNIPSKNIPSENRQSVTDGRIPSNAITETSANEQAEKNRKSSSNRLRTDEEDSSVDSEPIFEERNLADSGTVDEDSEVSSEWSDSDLTGKQVLPDDGGIEVAGENRDSDQRMLQSKQTDVNSSIESSSVEPEEKSVEDELDPRLFEQPFQKLPTMIALPSTQENAPISIGQVYIPPQYLMGAELIVYEDTISGRFIFDMERDQTDNQAWNITFAKNPRDTKTNVAVLKREDQELTFRWLDQAADNHQVGFLQNCVLKIFTPDDTAWLYLREPVEIEPLVLTPAQLSVSTPLEIDFAPAMESWWVEVLRPKIKEIRLHPNVIDIQRGLPGRILLKREDQRPLMWVNLALDSKSKPRLNVDIFVFEGRSEATSTSEERFIGSPLKGIPELENMIQIWKQREQMIDQQISLLESQTAPPGRGEEKKKMIAEMKTLRRQAKSYTTKLPEYYELLPKMFDQPYGVRIVAKLPDGLEIVLAESRITDED